MFYNVLNLKDMVECEKHKISKNVLLENDGSVLMIIGLKKDEIIDKHSSDENAFAHVLEGEVEFHFDAEKFNVKKGEFIMFKKGATHRVLALKDTKFLLVKI
jgi:quercetin dioxygenase-like cupin family protein